MEVRVEKWAPKRVGVESVNKNSQNETLGVVIWTPLHVYLSKPGYHRTAWILAVVADFILTANLPKLS